MTSESKPCPWCGAQACDRSRSHDDGTEYHCRQCKGRQTIKDEHPGHAFVFFPADIVNALCDDVIPLFPA